MKKMLKRILALTLALTMMLGLSWIGETTPAVAEAAEGDVVASGANVGEVNWTITDIGGENYRLSISTGVKSNGKALTAVGDYSISNNKKNDDPPWYTTNYAQKITELYIDSGITVIGKQAFGGLSGLN